MSFEESLNKTIRTCIEKYISEISTTYNLDKNELIKLWDCRSKTKAVSSTSQDKDLSKLSKNELLDLCMVKGIKCPKSKSKPDIICYLTGVVGVKKDTLKVSKSVKTPDNIVGKLQESRPTITIKKNDFGNNEHVETHFVFDPVSKKVIGKQCEDGTIADISKDDINVCNKYKFEYIIPENLNTGVEDVELNLVKTEKLDDDEYEEVEEEVEEEEEEIEIELDDDE